MISGLWLCCLLSHAQKEDYIWLSGYSSQVGYDSASGLTFGATVMDFNHTPREIRYDSLGMNFSATSISMCNSNGELLFYSNGIYVANALGNKIENSDSLNDGYATRYINPSVWESGYEIDHGMIPLQNGANKNQYYLLHIFADTLPNNGLIYFKSVLETLLDMQANGGLGKVIYKNKPVLTSNMNSDIAAVRHANGRDWWVVQQKRNTNCYYQVLVDPSGTHLVDSTCANVPVEYFNGSHEVFSNDGSMFAMITTSEGLFLFDFDRCNGTLSNDRFVPMPFLQDSLWIGIGVCFSPNNRFLYVSLTKLVLQYDLRDPNWQTTPDTVAVFDGHQAPFGSVFNVSQMGPDGKIYIGCGNGEDNYHVIDRPDEKGDSCLFRQHGLKLASLSVGVPNFPNYRLGALTGSACDTLTGITDIAEKEKILKVFPNPATNAITVDYGYTNWEKGDVDLEITNAAGQLIYTQHLPMYSGFQKLDVRQYAHGMYNVAIKRSNTVVATSQFVKK